MCFKCLELVGDENLPVHSNKHLSQMVNCVDGLAQRLNAPPSTNDLINVETKPNQE